MYYSHRQHIRSSLADTVLGVGSMAYRVQSRRRPGRFFLSLLINQSFINNKRANWPLTMLYKNIKSLYENNVCELTVTLLHEQEKCAGFELKASALQ